MQMRGAVAEPLWAELLGALDDSRESAGILLAGHAVGAEHQTLCFHKIAWVEDDAYDLRRRS